MNQNIRERYYAMMFIKTDRFFEMEKE